MNDLEGGLSIDVDDSVVDQAVSQMYAHIEMSELSEVGSEVFEED